MVETLSLDITTCLPTSFPFSSTPKDTLNCINMLVGEEPLHCARVFVNFPFA